MDIHSVWKMPLRIFGMTFFAILSFVVILTLFSLFVIGAGFGLGAVLGNGDITAITESDSKDYAYVSGDRKSENLLLVLDIEGPIMGSTFQEIGSPMDWMGVTYGYDIQEILKNAEEDKAVKGVFLHMRTPGGTIYGSMAIYDGIKAYQKASGNPALVYIEGLSASGGVMAMVGADAVYADRGSMVGSIGVVGGTLIYFDRPTATDGGLFGGGIVTEGGIEHTTISAGKGKDLGNPFRRPTPEEIESLQTMVENEYDAFVRHVAMNRDIEESVIREKMGAHVFDNKTAEEFGLIDGTLNKNESTAKLAEMANLEEDYRMVRPKPGRRHFLQQLLWTFQGNLKPARASREMIQRNLCETALRGPLVYHGDLRTFCDNCRNEAAGF